MLNCNAEIVELTDPAAASLTAEHGQPAVAPACNFEIARSMADKCGAIAGKNPDPIPVSEGRGFEDMSSSMNAAKAGSGLTTSSGRLATFVQVAEQNRRQLLRLAQRMTSDRDEAEDVVQEALLRAFKSLPRFRGESQMGTWLGVIVKNAGREWLRGRKGRVFLSLEHVRNPDHQPILTDFPDPGRNPEQCCVRKEIDDILISEIDGLNSVCKNTIRMCAIEESSHREAAHALGVSVGAIKSRIFHGKRMLKRAVSMRTGIGDEALHSFETARQRLVPVQTSVSRGQAS